MSQATGQRCVSLKTSSFPGIFGINLFLNIKSIDAFILEEEFMNFSSP